VGAEPGERAVGGGGHGRPQRGLVPDVERLASGGVAPCGDLAGLLESPVEEPHPLGRDGVLPGDRGEGVSGLAIGQHTLPEV
jgi:hypothetical protein